MTPTMRKIMVPLDGSDSAAQALTVAVALARAQDATLHLATVLPPVSTVTVPRPGTGNGASAESALREGLRSYVSTQRDVVRAAAGETVVTLAVLNGTIAPALARHAAEEGVALVVMTTHGWGGVKRFWLGSVADELLRSVRCPVLLLRPSSRPEAMGFQRVLVALETSEDGDEILGAALALGVLGKDTRYTLLQVLEPHIPLLLRIAGIPARTGEVWLREVRDCAAERLEGYAAGLRRRGLQVDARVLVGSGTAEQILSLAHQAGSDLIVVGTRGARGMERLVLGSVADKVVRGSSKMVLVVPLAAPPGSEAGTGVPAATVGRSQRCE